jgi:hypothetical protein
MGVCRKLGSLVPILLPSSHLSAVTGFRARWGGAAIWAPRIGKSGAELIRLPHPLCADPEVWCYGSDLSSS